MIQWIVILSAHDTMGGGTSATGLAGPWGRTAMGSIRMLRKQSGDASRYEVVGQRGDTLYVRVTHDATAHE